MTLLLLRHATAGHRRPGVGEAEDRLRPLDARGRRQANALPELYADLGVTRVLTSPYVRCRESVEPLARALACRSRSALSWRRESARPRSGRWSRRSTARRRCSARTATFSASFSARSPRRARRGWSSPAATDASSAAPTSLPRFSCSDAPRAGQEPARAQDDAALVDAHLVDLIDGDVHEPTTEQPRAHGEERRAPALPVEPYVLDDTDLRRRPEHAEAPAVCKRRRGPPRVPIPAHLTPWCRERRSAWVTSR